VRRGRAAALAGLLAATAGAAAGEPTLGSPTVTRLWRQGPDGPAPACTAAYVRDAGAVWLVTVLHCTAPGVWHAGRSAPEQRLTLVDAAAARSRRHGDLVPIGELAAGPAPTGHEALEPAARAPRAGTVWVHGFPFGVEHVTAARVLGDSAARPGLLELRIVVGPQTEAGPGFSGAPVIDQAGRVAGVLAALRADDARALTAFVVPVERLGEALARLAATLGGLRRELGGPVGPPDARVIGVGQLERANGIVGQDAILGD